MDLGLTVLTIIIGLIVLLIMMQDDGIVEYCSLCGRRIDNTQDMYYRAYDTETKQNIVMCASCGVKHYNSGRYHIHVTVYREY